MKFKNKLQRFETFFLIFLITIKTKFMKKTILFLLIGSMVVISSCATFNINEAAAFSHKCPNKHAKRLHMYQGKLYFN